MGADAMVMPPAPKPTPSVSISDFNPAEQRLLRAAFHVFVAFVLMGGVEDRNAWVIALGHPDGLAPAKDYPPGAKVHALIRIKGVDKQPDKVRLPLRVKRG